MNKYILILLFLSGCATEQGEVQKEIPGDVVPKSIIIQDKPVCYDQDNFPIECAKPKVKIKNKRRHK